MRTSLAALSVLAAAVLSMTSPTSHPASAETPTPASFAGPTTLVLDAQQLALVANAPLSIGFHADQQLATPATIVITSYQRIQSREDLLDAIAGNLPRSIDAIDVDPAAVVTTDGITTVTIPTETIARTSSALQFPQPGLYPVVVDIRDGDQVLGELLTFVDLLASATIDEPGSLNVSVVASVSAPPVIPGATSVLLARTLQALADLSAFPVTVPVSVAISPELLDRVSESTRDALRTLFDTNVVLSQPRIPLDPSAAVAAGKTALFTQLLREGEDEVTALGSLTASDRSIWLSSSQLTTGGAVLLRDLGARLLILPPSEYAAASGSLGAFTDTTQLVQTQLPDSTTVPTMVIDPIVATRLRDPSGSPEQAAMYVAADLVAIRDQIASTGAPVNGHTMIIGLDTGGVPNPTLLARVQEMTAPTGAVRFIGLDRVLRSTTTMLLRKDAPVEIVLPLTSPLDISARMNTLDALGAKASSLASMLIDDGGRAAQWSQTIDVLSSSSLTTTDVDTNAAALIAEFLTITQAVIPRPAYAFTLTGRRTTIRVPIENTGDEPLRVLLRLSATKLTFPRGDMVIQLEPHEITDVEIPVVARSNGSFPVTLEILSPDGSTQVADTLFLQARVSALTGLAQMLTGGGLLALLAWWVHHLRSTKRSRRYAEVMERHPAARPDDAREGHDESSANVADS